MGVIYTKDCDDIITIPNKKYKANVLKSYYDRHHNKLDKLITMALEKSNKCVIIDFHSFSDEMVEKLFGIKDNPDICIGIDEEYTDTKLVDFTVKHFGKYGFSVDINKPYSGTMIPNKYFNKKEKRLSSIMLEFNKRIYLNNKTGFYKLKNCIDDYYNQMKSI